MSRFAIVTRKDLKSGRIIRSSRFYSDEVSKYFERNGGDLDSADKNDIECCTKNTISWIVKYGDKNIAIPFEDTYIDDSDVNRMDTSCLEVEPHFNGPDYIKSVEDFDYMLDRIFQGILGFSNLANIETEELINILIASRDSYNMFKILFTEITHKFNNDFDCFMSRQE